jgi:ketosteroid isomerase-like protein
MTEHTDTSLHDLVTHTFATIEAKDLEAMMRVFADDAVVIGKNADRRCSGRWPCW